MTQYHDLRTELKNDFAQELAAFDGYEDEPSEDLSGDYLGRAEELLALLADPAHRLAILDAMGLDVREGWVTTGTAGHWYVDEINCDGAERAYVVRPRGEANR